MKFREEMVKKKIDLNIVRFYFTVSISTHWLATQVSQHGILLITHVKNQNGPSPIASLNAINQSKSTQVYTLALRANPNADYALSCPHYS